MKSAVWTTMTPANKDGVGGSTENDDDEVEDKALTFRKRRLSLDNLRQAAREDKSGPKEGEDEDEDDDPFSFFTEPPPFGQGGEDQAPDLQQQKNAAGPPAEQQDDEKAQSFRKRRLSLTLTKHEENDNNGDNNDNNKSLSTNDQVPPPLQRRRMDREPSNDDVPLVPLQPLPSLPPKLPMKRLTSRTIHASELLAHTNKPISTSTSQNNVLYLQKNAPPLRQTLDTKIPPQDMPVWSQSAAQNHYDGDSKQNTMVLPFPKDIVGTFSCHGVEPIYDHYEVEVADEEHEPHQQHHGHNEKNEKPTTAAKINQDRGGVSFPYGNCAKTALFAVYDGHGQGGELVSQFALHEIQRRLEQHPAFSSNVEKAFVDTFLQVNEDLAKEPYIEPLYAGTTACVGLLRDSQFVCANVGDSRAVCARRRYEDNGNHNGSNGEARPHSYEAIPLTIDQNPDLASETARIKEMGGFVSPPPEPGLSARVWLDRECTQIGLAMARSLGDYAVKEIGVIAEPVVTFHTVTNQDEFVVFATDGVWEFISSQEAVDVVANHLAQHNDATKACQALMELAAERWHDEEGDYRDDITALVVRLPLLW